VNDVYSHVNDIYSRVNDEDSQGYRVQSPNFSLPTFAISAAFFAN